MYQKLGFESGDASDPELANDWIEILTKENLDYTSSLRTLGEAITGNDSDLLNACTDKAAMADWLKRWRSLHEADDPQSIRSRIRVNLIYIPRNHLVEEALAAASDNGDLDPFNACSNA